MTRYLIAGRNSIPHVAWLTSELATLWIVPDEWRIEPIDLAIVVESAERTPNAFWAVWHWEESDRPRSVMIHLGSFGGYPGLVSEVLAETLGSHRDVPVISGLGKVAVPEGMGQLSRLMSEDSSPDRAVLWWVPGGVATSNLEAAVEIVEAIRSFRVTSAKSWDEKLALVTRLLAHCATIGVIPVFVAHAPDFDVRPLIAIGSPEQLQELAGHQRIESPEAMSGLLALTHTPLLG